MSLPRDDEWTDPGSMDRPPRRGRRIFAGLALLLLIAAGSAGVWRATSLGDLPVVGDPFDVAGFGALSIPDDENAFTFYRKAAAGLPTTPPKSGPALSWVQVPQPEKDDFFAHADAIEAWLAGTEKERALYLSPRELRFDTPLIHLEMRSLARLGELAAIRMEGQGDLDEAWVWLRAILRSSRHLGSDGSIIERLVGVSIYALGARAARSWADQPNLSTEALRKALDDVIAINAMTPGLAGNLKEEYLVLAAGLDDPTTCSELLRGVAGGGTTLDRLKERVARIWLREPERSRRAIRLVWANWLAVADLPVDERAARRRPIPGGVLYEVPADAPPEARRVSLDRLARGVESTLYARRLLPAIEATERAVERDAVQQAALVIGLAERLFERERGKPPESAEELVGPYLKALPEGYRPPGRLTDGPKLARP